MNLRNAFIRLADLAAEAIRPVAGVAQLTSHALLRLWRLASLRSRAKGKIPVTTQFDGPVTAVGTGRLLLGDYCRIGREVHFDTGDTGAITLGERVRINAGGVVVANFKISIGNDTLIGEYVSIRDANHGILRDQLVRAQPPAAAEIRIGQDVWVGRGACILKGVTIGDGAIVGANSVVTRDVPSNAIFAGIPARKIGDRKR